MNSFQPLARTLLAAMLAVAAVSVSTAAERGAAKDDPRLQADAADPDSQSASRLIGSTVKTDQNEKVGKVEDLFVDLGTGRIVGVILSSGGFLGIGDALSVIQPSSLSRTADGDLPLALSRETLAAAPRSDKRPLGARLQERWSDAKDDVRHRRDNTMATTDTDTRDIDRPRRVADADNTARNRRDRDPSLSVDPLDQGNSRSDVEITARIRSALVANDRLTTTAKNVKIVTRDGQVTLRGPVTTEEEKRVVDEIAAQAAPGRVSNQIEVKGR